MSFTYHDGLEVHPRCGMSLVPSYCQIIFQCMDGPHFVYSSIRNGHQNRLHFVATVSSDTVNIRVQVSGAHLLFLKHSPLPTEVSSCTTQGRDLLSPSLFCYHGTHPTPIQLLHRTLPPPGCSRQVHKEPKSWSLLLESWM